MLPCSYTHIGQAHILPENWEGQLAKIPKLISYRERLISNIWNFYCSKHWLWSFPCNKFDSLLMIKLIYRTSSKPNLKIEWCIITRSKCVTLYVKDFLWSCLTFHVMAEKLCYNMCWIIPKVVILFVRLSQQHIVVFRTTIFNTNLIDFKTEIKDTHVREINALLK